ncbi:MAG: hypothetical protein ABR564_03315 [Candidatus Dormibacteria bacterium]
MSNEKHRGAPKKNVKKPSAAKKAKESKKQAALSPQGGAVPAAP